MEILAINTHTVSHVFSLVFIGIMALLMTALAVGAVISLVENRGIKDIIGVLFFASVASLFSAEMVSTINEGPKVIYRAKISNFNEVYEKGYEIEGRNGTIYFLKQKEED